jgi:DNA-binding transcriptional ArsR family regulator
MHGDVNIASVAALLADQTRVNILVALSDGRALPAGELARRVRVASSTASNHLTKLMESGLLVVEEQGRHRYFRIANPLVVQALETLAPLAPTAPIRSLREAESSKAIRVARMCYNHLAGTLSVELTQALIEREVLIALDEGYTISDAGWQWLQRFGLDAASFQKRGYIFIPHHIDWSERRRHIAGAFAAAFAQHLFALGWIKRSSSSRAVHITERGHEALSQQFGWDGKLHETASALTVSSW